MKERVKDLMELHKLGITIFLSPAECADVMGITTRALASRRWRNEAHPPCYRVGRLIRYKLNEVVEWMEYEGVPGS